MKHLILATAILVTIVAAVASTTRAQLVGPAVPDLRGTWQGKGKALVYGNLADNPGNQTTDDPWRVRDVEATHIVEGQNGRVAWGRSSTSVTEGKEPFAWALSHDNRTITGADLDGYFLITLITPDRMEKCYAHNATSPSRSVVATCYVMDRVRK